MRLGTPMAAATAQQRRQSSPSRTAGSASRTSPTRGFVRSPSTAPRRRPAGGRRALRIAAAPARPGPPQLVVASGGGRLRRPSGSDCSKRRADCVLVIATPRRASRGGHRTLRLAIAQRPDQGDDVEVVAPPGAPAAPSASGRRPRQRAEPGPQRRTSRRRTRRRAWTSGRNRRSAASRGRQLQRANRRTRRLIRPRTRAVPGHHPISDGATSEINRRASFAVPVPTSATAGRL